MERKTNVLLVYEAFYVSVRLCGYEQLKYLSTAGKLSFQHGRDSEITAEQCRWADVVVIVRGATWLTWKISQQCKNAGKFLVYILDDDLLNVPMTMEAAKYYRQSSVHRRILWMIQNCDVFVSPSRYLLKKYKKLAVRTARIEEPCRENISKRMSSGSSKLKIGFAGSADRLSDVQQILEDALAEFYSRHREEAEIEFMGIKPALVDRFGFVYYPFEEDYEQYQKVFSRLDWDVGLAPMPDSKFHRGKHYNKYIEYGSIGCAGIYSDAIPYREVIHDKENGILCKNSKQSWINALEWCLDNRDLLEKMKANVRNEMKRGFGVSQIAERLTEEIPELISCQSGSKGMAAPMALYRKAGWLVRAIEFLARNDAVSCRKVIGKLQNMHSIREMAGLINAANINKVLGYIKRYGVKGLRSKVARHLNQQDLYNEWFQRHSVTKQELEVQKNTHFDYEPKISIIVPVYCTPVKMLREMVESVRAQSYAIWELCIADGSGQEGTSQLRQELQRWEKKDTRIHCLILTENQGISGNTNAALKMADGEYIGLLDHDDVLEPDALYEVVRVLQDKMTDIVYTDEDKAKEDLSAYGDPNFKPDFSIDLLRSHNYITHFLVIRRKIMEEAGGFRPEFDGAQDYDALLRCVEKADCIRHIAKPLYHWRMCAGSTADAPENKLYCYDAGRRALQEHLERVGLKGKVECAEKPLWGFYHTIYDVVGHPLVSIVIANKDHTKDLDKCIRSIQEKSTYHNLEFIVVENNSEEETTSIYYQELQKRYDNVKVVCWEGEFNYSAINNYGVSCSAGEYILLLNNDTEMIAPNAVEEMLGICCRQDVGIVGAKLLYGDNTVQHAGIVIGFAEYAGHVFHTIHRDDYGFMMRARINCNYSAVTAACLMTKRSVFEEVGGLTESFAVAANDVDYCLKARERGYLVVYSAYALWYHYESKTRGYEDTPEKQERFEEEKACFRKQWKGILRDGDPYYNKNFPVTIAPFTLD